MTTIKLSDTMRSRKSGKRKSSIGPYILFLALLPSVAIANEESSPVGESQTTVSLAKNELDKWVEAEMLISSEKRSWSEEKAFS